MRTLSKSILASAIVIASFSSFSLTADSNVSVFVANLFGRTHATVGNATLAVLPEGFITVSPMNSGVSGVEIALDDVRSGLSSSVNIHTQPIQINVGDSFTSNVVDETGNTLVSVRYEQVSATISNMYIKPGSGVNNSDVVSLATYDDGVETARSSVAVADETFIGTVESEGAWIKSYHWYCDWMGCSLMTDEEGGSLTFSDNPDQSVPFTYLAFDFGDNEAMRAGSALQLLGNTPFTIVEENNDVINLIY